MTVTLDRPAVFMPRVVDDATRRECVAGGLGHGVATLISCGDEDTL